MATSAVSSTVPAVESGRNRPLGGFSAIAQEARAIVAEPAALIRGVGRQRVDQAPEARAVIHLGEVGDLMRDDIVQYRLGGENEPPGKGERAACRAAPPTALRVAYGDPRHAPVDARGKRPGAPAELLARQRD